MNQKENNKNFLKFFPAFFETFYYNCIAKKSPLFTYIGTSVLMFFYFKNNFTIF